ncbi:SDR family oxidoreductase [Allosalinactinospora lopnorensis]|uniref:SDR family oxidoreductase n=1 Tax=Allosalinactinospora lopnorensis TaxID=1352348 RepID=UPI000623CF89|nr:SDR family oxidoreductase [Allosalinactinospora lopnorensis]
MHKQSLSGRCAVVTGGAGGIGAATVRALRAEGATVWITDVDDAAGEELAAELGHGTHYRHLDVTDESQWGTLEEHLSSVGETLSVLVNCAGAATKSPIVATPVESLRRMLELNLVGTFLGLQCAARTMNDGGAIVNISSLRGVLATAELGAYGAAKFGVRALSRVAAVEMADAGIRVNSICPGSIATQITDSPDFANDDMAAYVAGIPMQRQGAPEEVAQAVVYLATDQSSYVTGIDLIVDGGTAAGRVTPTWHRIGTGTTPPHQP